MSQTEGRVAEAGDQGGHRGRRDGMFENLITRAAWWRPRSSRWFFRGLALVVGAVVLGATALATWVAHDSGQELVAARDRGLNVALAIQEFRGHVSAADDELGAVVVDDPTTASGRPIFEAEVLGAAMSLNRAGLALPRSRDGETIVNLGERLERYGSLVATARSYPAGSPHALCAREVARLQLAEPADQVRSDAEATLEEAAGKVGGGAVPWAVGGLVLALVTLVLGMVLLAGRTRVALQLPLFAAIVVFAAGAVLTGPDLCSQRRELQAVDTELETYTTATSTAFSLFDVRAAELDVLVAETHGVAHLDAVACNVDDGLPEATDDVSERFDRLSGALLEMLLETPEESEDAAFLLAAVRGYVESVGSGNSAEVYGSARALAVTTAERSGGVIEARLENGRAASVEPALLVVVGIAATGLGVGGILYSGRRYR